MSSRTLGIQKSKCNRNRDPDYDRTIYNRSRVDIDFALKMWKQENARRKQPMHYRRRFATSSVPEQIGNIDQQVVPEWFVVPEEEQIVMVEEPEELLVLVNPEALVVQMGIEDLMAPENPEQQRMTPPVNPEHRMTPQVTPEQVLAPQVILEQEMRITPPENLEQRMTPPVNLEQRMTPPVNPEQRMTPPGNPDQLIASQVNPEHPVIPAENDEDVGPTDFDPSLLIQKLLKREVSPPPSSPYSRDYFLDPPVYLDISGTDTVEISEEDFHVTAYAPATTQSDSQMQSVPMSAFLHESVQNESNSATLHYQVQRDLMSVHPEAEQGTQYVHPASQTQPLLLNLSQFIDADRAAARCREIGYAATQKEIANFAALINARRSFAAYQYQDNRMTNSWQP